MSAASNDSHNIAATSCHSDSNSNGILVTTTSISEDTARLDRPMVAASSTVQPATTGSASTQRVQQETIQKKRFLLFIRILFKSLDQSEEDSELREIAKNIVSDCTRRNRLGDPECKPLMDAVDKRLRRHVGETHWRRAHLYMQHYMRREAARERLPQAQRIAMVWWNGLVLTCLLTRIFWSIPMQRNNNWMPIVLFQVFISFFYLYNASR